MKKETNPNQLVDAQGLLKALFPQECRPSLGWVRNQQRKRTIPFLKVSHFVFFDVAKVREALEHQHATPAKMN